MTRLSKVRRRGAAGLLLALGLLVTQAQPIKLVPKPGTALPELQPLPHTPLPQTPLPAAPLAPSGTTSAPRLPSDPLLPRQWNLSVIRAPGAWALLPTGRAPVTVAVLDTGFVPSPELGARAINGYDFVSDVARSGDGDGRDADGSGVGELAYHAEVVANIIGAGHDARGMAGLNPTARIVHVRVAGEDGQISVPDLVDGMKWAAGLPVAGVPINPNPARVLNLSLFADFIPLTGCDARVQAAVDAVTARGALVIAGAANDGADASGYSPAGCRGVLTVTSVTAAGARPAYANWGRSVALTAPGGEPGHGVVAASVSGPGGVREPDGTSFAAPQVAGVASLILSVRPKLSVTLLRSDLVRSVTPYGAPCDPLHGHTCGAGTLNAEGALRLALASAAGK